MIATAQRQAEPGNFGEAAATLDTLLGWLRPTGQYPDKIVELEAWQSMLGSEENPWE